jgi:hypothetical protein
MTTEPQDYGRLAPPELVAIGVAFAAGLVAGLLLAWIF